MNCRIRSHTLGIAVLLATAQSASAECPGPGCPLGRSNLGALLGGAMMGIIASPDLHKKPKGSADRATAPISPASARRAQTQGMVAGGAANDRQLRHMQNIQTQTALAQLGFPVGTIDGAIGPRTRKAIAAYQASVGLEPAGILTDEERAGLLARAGHAPTDAPTIITLPASAASE